MANPESAMFPPTAAPAAHTPGPWRQPSPITDMWLDVQQGRCRLRLAANAALREQMPEFAVPAVIGAPGFLRFTLFAVVRGQAMYEATGWHPGDDAVPASPIPSLLLAGPPQRAAETAASARTPGEAEDARRAEDLRQAAASLREATDRMRRRSPAPPAIGGAS